MRPMILVIVAITLLVSACATSPPRQVENLCGIFAEKTSWYRAARQSHQRWGSAIPLMMAFIHQESRFVSTAKPPRSKLLGFIPGPRKSSAYGYSQAQDDTWKWYKKSTGNWSADRDNFHDAIDFIGWYNHKTNTINGVSLSNVRNLYLAYHEGHGGFKRRTYRKKPWLMTVAAKVTARNKTYTKQFNACKKRLQSGRIRFWPFG